MAKRIFVTGGSGFVGASVLAELVKAGYAVNALSNRRTIRANGDVRTIKGDLFDAAALDAGMKDCDGIIHLVGIIMENPSAGVTFERIHVQGTRAVVDAAKRNGIRRYVHMSALGTRRDAVSEYHKTKFQAEEYVRASGLDFTILQPSLIHGPGGDFMKMEAMWARGKAPGPLFFQPFMPYFGGSSAGLLQPVYVGDVARAFVEALRLPATIGKTYGLAGPDQITWPQMHEIVARAVVGHRRWVAAIPLPVANLLVNLGIAPTLGFNRDQLLMSQENNTCDLAPFVADFGWTPQAFEPLVMQYGKSL